MPCRLEFTLQCKDRLGSSHGVERFLCSSELQKGDRHVVQLFGLIGLIVPHAVVIGGAAEVLQRRLVLAGLEVKLPLAAEN